MKALELIITLREPLLMTRPLTGEENSSISECYIPGSAIRGAAIRAWQGSAQTPIDLNDEELRQLFFRGGFLFLNAYPAHPGSQERSLPCPLSWMSYKDDLDEKSWSLKTIYDLALQAPQKDLAMERTKFRYFWQGSDAPEVWIPPVQNTVHNASLDRNKKKAGTSTVFRYESIPAGLKFVSVVLSKSLKNLGKLKECLDNATILLGGAHSAGYGRVDIDTQLIDGDWAEYASSDDEDPFENKVCVTLLSDAILRGSDGQACSSLSQWLTEHFTLEKQVIHAAAHYRLRLSGGYNRKAGLPLPQDWALEAGSTFVYDSGQLSAEQLAQFIEEGIGERREEGYGRIAVNAHMSMSFIPDVIEERPIIFEKPKQLSPGSQRLAKQTAQRILRTHLEKSLIQAINDTNLTNPLPKNAQLSRLRAAAAQAAAEHDLTIITRHVGQLKDSVKQLERCRVNRSNRMIDWLRGLITDAKIPSTFAWDLADLPIVAGEKAEITSELIVEFVARYIEGVLRKAVKANSQEVAR